MKKGSITKAVAVVMALIVILNIAFVAFRLITWQLFWAVIIIAAFVAYLVVPYMRQHNW
jgi:hypothetical protein